MNSFQLTSVGGSQSTRDVIPNHSVVAMANEGVLSCGEQREGDDPTLLLTLLKSAMR
jgi:hypothetical protein